MKIEHKRWRDLAGDAAWFHLARFTFLPSRKTRLHRHDFPEIFWVEQGEGWHEINGAKKKLYCGDLIFVRPEDTHVLSAAGPAGFGLVNLAFPERLRAELKRAHPREYASCYPSGAPLPLRHRLSSLELRTLREQVLRLAGEPNRRIHVERFLLELICLAIGGKRERADELPEWLSLACEAAKSPEVFARGTASLVEASGRSAEHVARTLKRHLGKTPTDVLNHARMEHAGRELRMTNRPILDIALECGLSNQAHFYTLFRRHFGETPGTYRKSSRRATA